MKRVLIGGLVAGVVLFVWGFVSNVVLPLGHMGIKQMPSEEAVVGAMKGAIPEPGLYFFPGIDMSRKLTDAEKEAWNEKYRAGPRGILIYHPLGAEPMSTPQLLTQLGTNVAAGLIAALLLSMTVGSYGKRVIFVTLLGLFAWLAISVPYWNWYGYPADFTLAGGIGAVAGALLAGLVLPAIVKPAKG